MRPKIILIGILFVILSIIPVSCSNWQPVIPESQDELPGEIVSDIYLDNQGNLWFLSNNGVTLYDGSNWHNFIEEHGKSIFGKYESVLSVYQDNQGNMWFGCSEGRIKCYNGAHWTEWRIRKSSSHDSYGMPVLPDIGTVAAITQDDEGNLWFGTRGDGIFRYDGVGWTAFTQYGNSISSVYQQDSEIQPYFDEESGFPTNSVEEILVDTQGYFWFGAKGIKSANVVRFDGTDCEVFDQDDGVLGAYALDFFEDDKGNIWVATYNAGAIFYDGDKWNLFSISEELAYKDIISIFQDKQGNMWFGTRGNRVIRYDGNRFTTFIIENTSNISRVSAICQDEQGIIWFGTYGGGVCYYCNGRIIPISISDQ